MLRAVVAERYTVPTLIQAQAIPHLLAGRDLLGVAQTGTGKTAAFALPILQRLAALPNRSAPRAPRALILAPTRELAAQICDSFRTYGRHLPMTTAAIYGGVGYEQQIRLLGRGVDIVVATPGRLLDLLGQRHIRLDNVQTFVLDEADRMLDMGFIEDIRLIVRNLPTQRQTLMFSATMPRPIAALAQALLTDPLNVVVAPGASTVAKADQRVVFVESSKKSALLCALLRGPNVSRALIFTRTKRGANRLVDHLADAHIAAEVLHGNKTQSARQRALDNFRAGHSRFLVATDIAARGIDVEAITHVFNYDVPEEPEAYIHRIGRTARAGAGGTAITLCSLEERSGLRDIERLIGLRVPVLEGHAEPEPAPRPFQARPTRPGYRPGRRSFGPRR